MIEFVALVIVGRVPLLDLTISRPVVVSPLAVPAEQVIVVVST